jgi:hypothetical protein
VLGLETNSNSGLEVVTNNTVNHNTQSNLLHPPISDHIMDLIQEISPPQNGNYYTRTEIDFIVEENPDFFELFVYFAFNREDLLEPLDEDLSEDEDINTEDNDDSEHEFLYDDSDPEPNSISIPVSISNDDPNLITISSLESEESLEIILIEPQIIPTPEPTPTPNPDPSSESESDV